LPDSREETGRKLGTDGKYPVFSPLEIRKIGKRPVCPRFLPNFGIRAAVTDSSRSSKRPVSDIDSWLWDTF